MVVRELSGDQAVEKEVAGIRRRHDEAEDGDADSQFGRS